MTPDVIVATFLKSLNYTHNTATSRSEQRVTEPLVETTQPFTMFLTQQRGIKPPLLDAHNTATSRSEQRVTEPLVETTQLFTMFLT
jgi:hypothetical protein